MLVGRNRPTTVFRSLLRSSRGRAARRLRRLANMDPSEADDLLMALSIVCPGVAAGATSDDRPQSSPSGGGGAIIPLAPAPPEGDVGLEVDVADDHEDLLAVVAVMQQPAAPRKFEARSWQLAAHARAAKALKKETKRADDAVAERASVEARAALVARQVPAIRKMMGIDQKVLQKVSPEISALLSFQLAVARPASSRRGEPNLAMCQARAAHNVSAALLEIQGNVVADWVTPLHAPTGFRIVAYGHQWDETHQSLRTPVRSAVPGASVALGPVRVDTMMQSGRLAVTLHSDGKCVQKEGLVFCKPLYIWRQTADFLLEGLVRRFPAVCLDFVGAAACSDVAVLCFTCDGASANTAAMRWVWDRIIHSPTNKVIAHRHLCSLHRLAVARSRNKRPHELGKALLSFARWMRHAKNVDGLVTALHHVVSENFCVVQSERPKEFTERAGQFLELVYKSGGGEYLVAPTNEGEKATRLLADLEALMSVVDLRTGSETAAEGRRPPLTHWCCVVRGSPDHLAQGLTPGARCCADREEGLNKVLVPIVNWIAGRNWHSLALNRWTHIPTACKRAMLSCAGPSVLPAALGYLQVAWGVPDTLEANLARIVAEDGTDMAAQGRLRLIRLCRVMCDPEVPRDLSLVVVTGAPLDDLMYALFGFGSRKQKATILDLLRPGTSPISQVPSLGRHWLVQCRHPPSHIPPLANSRRLARPIFSVACARDALTTSSSSTTV